MEKPVMLAALENSGHSFDALDWTLQHFFSTSPKNYPFKLVIVHVKPSAASTLGIAGPGYSTFRIGRMAVGFGSGSGTPDVLPLLAADLKKIAQRVMEKAEEICNANSVIDVTYEILEGDARNVLCNAVERHQAAVLVVGSHGYGALKRAVLGSVSDYCAHHSRCSVMIVKRPKIGY